jgi:hypothetical protein
MECTSYLNAMLSVIILSVVMLSIVMLGIVMLSVFILSVIVLNIVMLSAVGPRSQPLEWSPIMCSHSGGNTPKAEFLVLDL